MRQKQTVILVTEYDALTNDFKRAFLLENPTNKGIVFSQKKAEKVISERNDPIEVYREYQICGLHSGLSNLANI